VQLLKYLTDPAMRRRVTAATNKVEAYNGFSEWVRFGNRGVLADNDPEPEDLARVSPYLTGHIMRFGQYSIHELGLEPEAYEPHLDVDFTKLEPDEPDGQQEAA
jgi:Tn3 transposase DDE domain